MCRGEKSVSLTAKNLLQKIMIERTAVMGNLLDRIDSPQDLRALAPKEIPTLNREIREFLLENVPKTGGHLASNLGVVELTVALHRVFDFSKDHILFDVGHQSYVHKLLTGRKGRFDTLRGEDGLSGFTKRSESSFDCFGAGHSSTSLSAALGFAEADRLNGSDAYTVAVVGDGAFTGGMIYEALNNCERGLRLIIILNDNEMSISPNVGNLSKHISRIRATKGYLSFKRGVSVFFDHIPIVGAPMKNFLIYVKTKIKGAVYNLNIFENMGIRYLGPIDGNDYYSVETLLREAKKSAGCVLVHMKTVKGCGYEKAVQNPEKYHGISPIGCRKNADSFSEEAGKALCELAERDEDICAVTAAMSCGTGLESFRKRYPSRYFDVGIAEAHAVTFFAGLSAAGKKPVFAVYSTFLQRAYDSLLHDVALQSLGGLLLIDRAGFAPEDGATHHGIYDAAFLSEVRGLTLYEPIGYDMLRDMMRRALSENGLFAVRYPKGAENRELINAFGTPLDGGDAFDFRICGALPDGTLPKNVAVTYGRIAGEALKAQKELAEENIDCAVVQLLTLKPPERQAKLLADRLPKNAKIAFLEEGIYEGGIMMQLRELLLDAENCPAFESRIFALRGEIPEQAPLEHLYRKCHLAKEDLTAYFREGRHEN